MTYRPGADGTHADLILPDTFKPEPSGVQGSDFRLFTDPGAGDSERGGGEGCEPGGLGFWHHSQVEAAGLGLKCCQLVETFFCVIDFAAGEFCKSSERQGKPLLVQGGELRNREATVASV